MKTVFKGKRIAGILTVMPEACVKFEDEVSNYSFPEKQTLRLQNVMGYKQHRIAKETTSTGDLCAYGIQALLDSGRLKKEDIGAIVVVTLTPDHFVPHVSNLLHGKFSLPYDVVCLDVLQGCCGYLVGIMQACMLLAHMDKKVVLCNGDVLSRKTSRQDRNSYPLIGDAATITILENDPAAKDIYLQHYNDGTRADALVIEAGGSRMPCSAETAAMQDDGEGNLRSLDNLRMNGSAVFQFVVSDAPPLIEDTLMYAGVDKEDIEWFLCHQPNRFMLRKLAEKLQVPYEKMPMNIVEEYGNSSGATIPVAITANLAKEMCEKQQRCCLTAFGSGLAWGCIVAKLGDMDFCETCISNL